MRSFENPLNGYVEEVGTASVVLTTLLGPLYLAYRGAWGAAFLALIGGAVVFVGAMLISKGEPGPAILLWLGGLAGLAFLLQPLICAGYLRRGWKER